MKRESIYIAGPVYGNPRFQEQFDDAARYLSSFKNISPISPLMIPPTVHFGACPPGYPGGEGAEHNSSCYLRSDIKVLMGCTGIYMMDGWMKSRRAVVEFAVANAIGLDIYFETVPDVMPIIRAFDPDNYTVVPMDDFYRADAFPAQLGPVVL